MQNTTVTYFKLYILFFFLFRASTSCHCFTGSQLLTFNPSCHQETLWSAQTYVFYKSALPLVGSSTVAFTNSLRLCFVCRSILHRVACRSGLGCEVRGTFSHPDTDQGLRVCWAIAQEPRRSYCHTHSEPCLNLKMTFLSLDRTLVVKCQDLFFYFSLSAFSLQVNMTSLLAKSPVQ